MTLLARNAVVLAKVETTYGSDASPTVSADAILCEQPTVTVNGDILTRDYVRSNLSPLPHIIGMTRVSVTITTELKTNGDAGAGDSSDPPEIDALLRACGMQASWQPESAGGADDGYVTYTPRSSGFESCTIYVYQDDVLHKITGCYGTFSLTLTAGQYPKITFDMTGLYTQPIDSSPSSATYSSAMPQVVTNSQLTIDSYSATVETLELAINNNIAERTSVNASSSQKGLVGLLITGRDPSGSFNPEAVTEAEEDFWDNWTDAEEMSLVSYVGYGDVSNQIKISCPKVQYNAINWGDRNGILTYEIPLRLCGNSGDDEIEIRMGAAS